MRFGGARRYSHNKGAGQAFRLVGCICMDEYTGSLHCLRAALPRHATTVTGAPNLCIGL